MNHPQPSPSSDQPLDDSTARRRAEQSNAAIENTSTGYGGAEADAGAYNPPEGLLDKISGKPDKPADSASGKL